MRKFLFKLLIFSLPFIVFVSYIAYEILILPIDHFTFRSWEALKVYENNSILTGPFYPNSYLHKMELGDLSGRTKFPSVKDVEWFTDNFGYRKKENKDHVYKIVVIGDSAIAGSSLTQTDMFTEKLGDKLNVEVYPFAPSNFNKFLADERFIKNPPDLVIFESAEKLVLHIPAVIPNTLPNKKINSLIVAKLAVYIDRLKKEAFINYLYARLAEIPKKIFSGEFNLKKIYKRQDFITYQETSEMVFYSEPEDYFKNWQQIHIDRVVEILKGYKEELTKRNTKFVFMPIPNKENIYWELVKGGKPNDNLKRLITASKKGGIATIDLLTPYQKIHQNNLKTLLYHLDDSHWNPYGVDVAVSNAVYLLK